MKAMVMEDFGKPLVYKDMPLPRIGPRDALVKVKAAGVCRTDLKVWRGRLPVKPTLPHILGHEIAGVVAEVGAEVTAEVDEVSPGDHVVVHFYVTCGRCYYCLRGREPQCAKLAAWIGFREHGGYAEYVAVPARNLVRIPREMEFEEAAVLPDAVATTVFAVRDRARVRCGETVLVIGIGGLGVHAIQAAKVCGATVLAADISEDKLALGREFGAEETLDSRDPGFLARLSEITGGSMVDAVVDCAGTPATAEMTVKALRKCGRAVFLGYSPGESFSVPSTRLVLDEIAIMGSRACSRADLEDTVRLVASGRIRPFVSDRYRLDEANRALAGLEAGTTKGRSVLVLD